MILLKLPPLLLLPVEEFSSQIFFIFNPIYRAKLSLSLFHKGKTYPISGIGPLI